MNRKLKSILGALQVTAYASIVIGAYLAGSIYRAIKEKDNGRQD